MRCKIFSFLILLQFTSVFKGQCEVVKGITIRGQIEDGLAKSLEAVLIDDIFPEYQKFQTRYPIDINSNSFMLNIPSDTRYSYVRLVFTGTRKTIRRTFLFEKGDSVILSISSNGFYFSGRGAAKLNCQDEIQGHDISFGKGNGSYADIIHERKRRLDSTLKQGKIILNRYKSQVGKEVYNILDCDVVGDLHLSFLTAILSDIILRKSADLKFLHTYLLTYFRQTIPREAIYSISLLDFLYKKERTLSRFLGSGFRSNYSMVFGDVYRRLMKYNGALREKLITIAFIDLQTNSLDIYDFLDKEIASMRHISSRRILSDMKKAAYDNPYLGDFVFQDTAGNLVHFKDFKGKKIIIDFWFRGCGGCKGLNIEMRPVYDSFMRADSIIFVSVNVDARRDTWIKGLNEKSYTHGSQVCLNTGGSGTDHPLLKRFNYIGFPQLLIIGTDGKLVTANPPRPNNPGNVAKLLKLISL